MGKRHLSFLEASVYFFLPWLDSPLFPGNSYTRPFSLCLVFIWFIVSPKKVFRGIREGVCCPPFLLYTIFVFWMAVAALGLALTGPQISLSTLLGEVSLRASAMNAAMNVIAGYAFFIFVIATADNDEKWRRIFFLVKMSAVIVFGFALIQYAAIKLGGSLEAAVIDILNYTNFRGRLGHGKPFGLMPEGSFLGDYFATLILPISLARALFGGSFRNESGVSKRRLSDVLFILGSLLIIILASSRVGLLAAAAMAVVCAGLLGSVRLDVLSRRWTLIAAVTLAVSAFIVGYRDELKDVLSTFTTPSQWEANNLISNTTRAAGMQAALDMGRTRLMGVGPGAYPFYYALYVPDWALWNPEVAEYLDGRSVQLPNPKGLLPRILAELGIMPTLIYLAFAVVMLKRCACATRRSHIHPDLGAIGLLALTSVFISSISTDTFIFCHYYVVFGLACWIGRRARQQPKICEIRAE